MRRTGHTASQCKFIDQYLTASGKLCSAQPSVVSSSAALFLRGAVLLLSVYLSPVTFLVNRVHKSRVFRRVPMEPARRWPEPRGAALSGRHGEHSVSWRAVRAESRKSESCVKHCVSTPQQGSGRNSKTGNTKRNTTKYEIRNCKEAQRN